MAGRNKLAQFTDSLLKQGDDVIKTSRDRGGGGQSVDDALFHQWLVSCRLLLMQLGKYGQPFSESFTNRPGFRVDNWTTTAKQMQASLLAIHGAISNGLLVNIEDLILAEAFDDLLEQADHLLGNGYFLAAGVLGRAVLEEHLRKWCDRVPCVPQKPRPTMNDFKEALGKADVLNALEKKHVDSIAAVGNSTAHNDGKATKEDVERMLRDVREFITHHPLS